jgi:hypothetical protein
MDHGASSLWIAPSLPTPVMHLQRAQGSFCSGCARQGAMEQSGDQVCCLAEPLPPTHTLVASFM